MIQTIFESDNSVFDVAPWERFIPQPKQKKEREKKNRIKEQPTPKKKKSITTQIQEASSFDISEEVLNSLSEKIYPVITNNKIQRMDPKQDIEVYSCEEDVFDEEAAITAIGYKGRSLWVAYMKNGKGKGMPFKSPALVTPGDYKTQEKQAFSQAVKKAMRILEVEAKELIVLQAGGHGRFYDVADAKRKLN
jgi:hypothetical protein